MSILWRTRLLGLTLVPLMGLGLLAAPGAGAAAGAAVPVPGVSPGSPMVPAPPTTPGALTGAVGNTIAHSTNWSGYAAGGSTYTSVSSSWVEPAVTCTSTTSVAGFWVGLDGYGSGSVEQTGTAAQCVGGSAGYYTWYEMYPNPSVAFPKPVAPGDAMTASVTSTSPTTFVIKISDATQGWSEKTVQTAATAPALASAEVITEAPSSSGGILPLADFATISYTKAHVDGLAIGKSAPIRIEIVNSKGALEDTTSKLAADGFMNTWIRS